MTISLRTKKLQAESIVADEINTFIQQRRKAAGDAWTATENNDWDLEYGRYAWIEQANRSATNATEALKAWEDSVAQDKKDS